MTGPGAPQPAKSTRSRSSGYWSRRGSGRGSRPEFHTPSSNVAASNWARGIAPANANRSYA